MILVLGHLLKAGIINMTLKARLHSLKAQPTPAKLNEFFNELVNEIEALKEKDREHNALLLPVR